MRALLFHILAAIALMLSLATAAAAQDLTCLTDYVAGTPYEPGADKDIATIEEAATRLQEVYALADLPAPAADAAAWCAFANSPAGSAIRLGMHVRRYGVEIGDLPDVDDGISQLKYDFSKLKLATRYDGVVCKFDIERDIEGKTNLLGYGKLTVDQGRISFTEATWLTKGEATPDSFRRSNLAITEKGTIVGRLLVYGMFVPDGAVPKAATDITIDGKDQKGLGKTEPVGEVKFPIEYIHRGKLSIVSCLDKDGNPIKRAFDFSKIKIATDLNSDSCRVNFDRLLYGEGQTIPQRIGTGRATLKEGRFTFATNFWQTQGPSNSLLADNIAISKSRDLVGIMDVYFVFPTKELPNPEYKTIVLKGGKQKLSEDMKGEVRFPIEPGIDGIVSVQCK